MPIIAINALSISLPESEESLFMSLKLKTYKISRSEKLATQQKPSFRSCTLLLYLKEANIHNQSMISGLCYIADAADILDIQ